MQYATRNPWRWQIRLGGFVLLICALLVTMASQTPAYADDWGDDDDPGELVTTGPNACTAIPNVPIYQNATCVKHSSEQDDGGVETENHYTSPDAVDVVRRAFEAALRQSGWALVGGGYDAEDREWEYALGQGSRRVEVTIDAARSAAGGTNIEIEEE